MKPASFLSAFFAMAAPALAALTVTPDSIDNAYNGAISLAITGLNNSGQRVVVEKFFDLDGSATVTAADLLMLQFEVTDGQTTSVAGHRNINVPGDNDSLANGSIQTAIHFTPGEIPGRLDGRFIFRVSPAGAGFTPFTDALQVTQKDYGGSGISGRVMAGASPQAGAIVLITQGSQTDFDVAGLTKTDAAGNYTYKAPPGYYRPVPVKSGFVFDLGSSSAANVSDGSVAAAGDALLTPGARTIGGQVRDNGAPPVPLGGMLVYQFGEGGSFSLTFAGATGQYTLDAAAGFAELGLLAEQCALMGVIPAAAEEETGDGNITGLDLITPRPTALIHGTARTGSGTPVPWLDIFAQQDSGDDIEAFSITDSAGNYSIGVTTGDWRLELETPGYLAPQSFVHVSAPGVAALQDITVNPVTAHLRGTVRDSGNQPVPGVEILAHDFTGAGAWSTTDAAGNFDLGVHGGPGGTSKTWAIQLNQNSEDNPATHISSQVQFDVTDGNDINGITYRAYLITAHLRGTVLDETNAPVGGVNLHAVQPGGDALTGSNVGADGSFDIPVFAGTWRIGMSFPLPGGFMAQDNLQVTANDGTDVTGLVFRLRRTSGTISGSVKNTGGSGLDGLTVSAAATIGGVQFSAFTTSSGGGNFSLTVCPGLWSVSVDGNALAGLGYQPVPSQEVNFNSGNSVVNFTAGTGGATTFSSWQSASFTAAELLNPGISGPDADPDRDLITNFLEYALNLAPKQADAGGLPAAGVLPGAPGGGQYLTLTFRRRIGAQGLSYNALESASLTGPWTGVTFSYEVIFSDGTTETVRARTVITPGTPKFMRLQVNQQP